MLRNLLIIAVFLSVAAGCSGGEPIVESSRDDDRDRPALPEPAEGSSVEAWSGSDEYRSSTGLAQVNAAEGYAARTTGQAGGGGKTVAILDTPVDLVHPELDGVTYNFRRDRPDFSDREIAHGTHVAGIVAARRDGEGVHGIAYDADLVGIGVLRAVRDNRKVFLHPFAEAPTDIAAGIASAAGLKRKLPVYDRHGVPVIEIDEDTGLPARAHRESNPKASADILNLSLVTDDRHGQVWEAMRDAAAVGRILVTALGNCGGTAEASHCRNLGDGDGVGPTAAPASYVARLDGHGIAVGALDTNGTERASFSNTCGEVMEHCLFAPGVGIRSTIPGDAYDELSGTSMAAPHVSGAAAVAWAAFPNKSGSEIASRLLDTARPLDGQEVSPVFGHGALDLAAALQPVGEMDMPVPGGRRVPLANSAVDLPPGFHATPVGPGIANAVAYDGQGFPFLHDLGSAFREHPAAPAPYLSLWLSEIDGRSSLLPLGTTAAVHLVHDSRDPAAGQGRGGGFGHGGDKLHGYLLRIQPSPELSIGLGMMHPVTGFSNRAVAERMNGALLGDRMSTSPYAAFAGRGIGVNIDWQFSGNTTLDVLGRSGTGLFGSANAELASVGLTRTFGSDWAFGMRYGTLREQDSRVGIRAAGTFGGLQGSTSRFIDLSAVGNATERLALLGSLTYGTTGRERPESGSLVSNWSGMRADAVQFGGEIEDVWLPSDRLFLAVQLPFRLREGRLTVRIPVEEIEDGVVRFEPRTVNLAPRGREKRVQLSYQAPFRQDVVATFGGYARVEPDHDASADPEFGAGVKLRVAF